MNKRNMYLQCYDIQQAENRVLIQAYVFSNEKYVETKKSTQHIFTKYIPFHLRRGIQYIQELSMI